MEGLQPTIDIGGNNNGMGNWGGALIGGAIGGAVGSAWGRGGNWNNGNCCGGGCCGNNGNQYVMESLTTMRSDVDSIGRDQLMQVANLIAQLAATHANEVQGMRNTFDIVSAQKDCCCTTKQLISDCCCETNRNIERQGCETRNAIHAEGEATRALMAQLDRERLLREMGAKDARIAQLEAQNFNTNLANNAAQQNRNDMQSMLNTILAHLPTTSSGGTASR